MTIKVLEHNGIYTTYRRIIKRSDDGQLYESLKRIDFPSPPPNKDAWSMWSVALTHDALDAGIQIYFDKWNFGNGTNGERAIYELLYDERISRKTADGILVTAGVLAVGTGTTLPFPVIKK